ncbi:MAG TPA: c-type cytochrome [Bacillota bacterium]
MAASSQQTGASSKQTRAPTRTARVYGVVFSGVAVVSAAVFVGLNLLSLGHLDLEVPEAVLTGKEAWQRAGCVECHTLFGNGGYSAPDLTRVTDRRTEAWLVDWLTTGKVVRPTRQTAHLVLTRTEAEAVVELFRYTAAVPTGWDANPARSKGAEP